MASDFADYELLSIADREDIAETCYVMSASGTSSFHPIADILYQFRICDRIPVRRDHGSMATKRPLFRPTA